jgi:hypothetical protein
MIGILLKIKDAFNYNNTMEIRINDKYIISLNERLGKGAFGQIYKGFIK